MQNIWGICKGVGISVLMLINIFIWTVPLIIFSILKLLSPTAGMRMFMLKRLEWVAYGWQSWNFAIISVNKIHWDLRNLELLQPDKTYLLLANHQSWVDIFAIMKAVQYRTTFTRFFIKNQLTWLPILGQAFMAVEFIPMKRYTKAYLEKHPEKRGTDIEETRRKCEMIRRNPSTIINFPEGTRFDAKKYAQQQPPYQHLLQPKTGGVAFTLNAMSDQVDTILDITIAYPDGVVSFWEFLCGKLKHVIVDIRTIPNPPEFLNGNYQEDPEFREFANQWLNGIWQEKDQKIAELLQKQ